MKKILLFVFCMVFLNVFSQNVTQKYHRAKINYNSKEKLEQLIKLGVPMDHGTHKKGYFIISDFSDKEIQLAKSLGLTVEIEIEDVQKYYVDQNKKGAKKSNRTTNTNCNSNTIDYQTPINYSNGSMGGYLTYAQMLQALDDMRSTFPDLITARENVGTYTTQEGRALQWVKITKNPTAISTKPQVLYTAIHHAREPVSLSETIFYMWYLLENYETNPEVKSILDSTELYFIPVVNPDGYIFNETTNPSGGGMWRKNRHNFGAAGFGVDNNRNYDYWVGGDVSQSVFNTTGVSAEVSGETYPGTAALSEPETQAINYFLENHHFKVAINAHTHSNLLLYPYGYEQNVPSPDDALFQGISKLMVSQNGFTNEIASLLYSASGDSDDFMYGQTMTHDKIFAFTPEIGGEFWPSEAEIIPLCKGMMYTNLCAARFVSNFGVIKETMPQYVGNGATFNSSFELVNYGLNELGNFTVSIVPVSGNITAVGPPMSFTNMATLDNIVSSIPISLATGTTSGDAIVYDLVLNNGTFDEVKRITKKFGVMSVSLDDPASTLNANFTTSNWGLTTEKFVSPTKSFTDSPNVNYGNSQNKVITLSNPIDLTTATGATITYSAQWSIENDWDYVQFQISTNNGASWTPQCGKYTNLGSSNTEQPEGQPLYDGLQSTWVQEEIDLSEYLGQTIKARFQLRSDNFQNFDGFYFDDFKVNLLQPSVLATTENSMSAFSIFPNPMHDILHINSTISDYNVEIYNIQGQLVLNENTGGMTDINVNNLNAGVYLIKIKSQNRTETKKIIKQ